MGFYLFCSSGIEWTSIVINSLQTGCLFIDSLVVNLSVTCGGGPDFQPSQFQASSMQTSFFSDFFSLQFSLSIRICVSGPRHIYNFVSS